MELQDWEKPVVVTDIAQVKARGRKVTMDLTEDAWSFGAPPAKGHYKLKLFMAKDGTTQRRYDKNSEEVYYNFALECKVVSEDVDVDGYTIYVYASTRIPKRKNISTAAGMIVKMGYKLPTNELDDVQLAKLFSKAIKNEPVIGVDIDWRASYDTGKLDKLTGRKVYKNVCNHYEDFPETEDKTSRISEFTHTADDGGKYEIRAQLFVGKWYGKGETPTTVGNQVKGPQFVKAVEPELDLQAPTLPTAAPTVAHQPAQANVDDDLALMLQT
jgi:hypothetical protein